jgi:ATP-binding cassette subfamily B protein
MRTGRYLWRLLLYRPVLYGFNMLLWLIVHVWPILPGLVVREYFDALVGQSRTGLGIWPLVAISMGLAAARIVNIGLGAMTDIRHRFMTKSLLTVNLFGRLLERPGVVALQDTVGEAISRFRDDVHQIEDSLSWVLDSVGMAAFAVASLLVLMSINARIAVLTFVPMVAVVALSRVVRERVEAYRRASRDAASEAVGALGEVFTAVQGVKLGAAEARAAAHVSRLNERRRQLQLKDRLVTEVLSSIYHNTVSIGTGLILLLAAGSMADGTFTVGDFSLFAYYLGFVTDFTQFFGIMLVHIRQTGVAFSRLAELLHGGPVERLVQHNPVYLDTDPPPLGEMRAWPAGEFGDRADASQAGAADGVAAGGRAEGVAAGGRAEGVAAGGRAEGVAAGGRAEGVATGGRLRELTVRGLTCLYPRTGKGVRDVDLTIRRGEFVVVTGRIGSGKTTLLRAIIGMVPLEAGEIAWNGRAVDDPRTFFGPPRSSYTPQVPVLFSDSLRGNILMGWPADDAGAELGRALSLAAFEKDLEHMPSGLDTVVGARGLKLSGGQQHRAAAARMFLRRPDLLLIDDLSSAVDVETESVIWSRLFAEPGLTCLVVSHRRAALRRADQVLVMRDGRVADRGCLKDLLERCEELQEIWDGG